MDFLGDRVGLGCVTYLPRLRAQHESRGAARTGLFT